MSTQNELLAAAKELLDNPQEDGWTVRHSLLNKLSDVVVDTEREAAELAEPIDEKWLSKIARQSADGWVINAQLTVWYGEHCHEWLAMHTGAGTAIKLDGGREQLLSLLRGLGIEAAK